MLSLPFLFFFFYNPSRLQNKLILKHKFYLKKKPLSLKSGRAADVHFTFVTLCLKGESFGTQMIKHIH